MKRHESKRHMLGPAPGSKGAKSVSAAHKGSHKHDQTGGFSDRDLARRAGRIGGQVVKEKFGIEFYRKIGRMGGISVKETHGSEHYSRIGKLGGHAKAKKIGKGSYRS